MVIRLQVRHDTKANWETHNPVLAVGEIGIETDNPNDIKIKIGDGDRNWISLPYIDENVVHKKNDETVGGIKTFSDSVTFSNGIFIPNDKRLNGLASNALYDSENNQIDTYYQKSLSNKVAVTEEDDWNNFVEEGYYKVDISAFGPYSDKHTPNQFKSDMNPTGILLVFHNDNIVTQMYIPYINSHMVYRSYNGTSWTDWLSLTDENAVHNVGDETIGGLKTFSDVTTFSNGIYIPNGKMLNGLVSNALYDSENNQIDTYYQKSLSNKVAVTEDDDWNNFKEEGYYKVDITNFGSYLDKHTPNQLKSDMNPTGILLVFHNDSIVTQMYIPYINSPIVYRSYDGTAWTDWLSIIDEHAVHTIGDETIGGVKTFSNDVIFSSGISIPSGEMLNGLVSNALYDSKNNQIDTYYQKSLSNKAAVLATDDWNNFTEEGYYKVDITAFGSYLDKHTPNQFKSDINSTGILLVFCNDDMVTQMYIPYINSPIVYRSYNGTTWTDWLSISDDENAVHIVGDETIEGVKTFSNDVILGGNVNFNNPGDIAFTKEGLAFLKQDSTGVVYISSKNGAYIYLRPNGENSTVGQVVIDSQGTIDGNAKKDGAGNEIVATYARKDEMQNYAQTLGLAAIVASKSMVSDENTYNALLELLDISVGTATDVIDSTISIPYTMSNNGIKIVDVANKAQVDSCYERYNTANYFIIDKTNKLVQFPYDSVDGRAVKLGFKRASNGKTYEYDTNLECTQSGLCTSGTAVTFDIPFADTNYTLTCPYSAKTATGFTPSQTGGYIAKGRILLSSVPTS